MVPFVNDTERIHASLSPQDYGDGGGSRFIRFVRRHPPQMAKGVQTTMMMVGTFNKYAAMATPMMTRVMSVKSRSKRRTVMTTEGKGERDVVSGNG